MIETELEQVEEDVLKELKFASPDGLTRPELCQELPHAEVKISRCLSHLRDDHKITTAGLRHGFPIYYFGGKTTEHAQKGAVAPPSPEHISSLSVPARVLLALEQHGPMDSPKLRIHVDIYYLDVTLSKLCKAHKVRRVGFRGNYVYGLPGVHSDKDMERALDGKPPSHTAAETQKRDKLPKPPSPAQFHLSAEGDLLFRGARLLPKANFQDLVKFVHAEEERLWQHMSLRG